MTDLREPLSRLGLAQYIEKFKEEGFETWETLLDITESDLDALGVKLGHRRLLQKEIGQARGLSVEQLSSPSFSRPPGEERGGENRVDVKRGTGVGGKRKYRRHPKADENAPERAPSAYVIFSNKIREELKPQNLSFTAIAKRVGERWQELSAGEKEPYESEASTAKEKYHTEMAEYKTTRSYREYQQYLGEFKAKNSFTSDGKRPKLVQEEITTSSGSIESLSYVECQEEPSSASIDPGERRFDSMSSVGPHSSASGLPSPASVTSVTPASRGGVSSIIPLGTASPVLTSPSTPSVRRLSSTWSSLHGSLQDRPSTDTYSERGGPPGTGQQNHRFFPNDKREKQTAQGSASGPFHDPRPIRGRTSPLDQPYRFNRIPNLLEHSTSDSSLKSSIGSTVSSTSTAPSSIFSAVTLDEEKRSAVSLPPLAKITTNSVGGASSFDSAAQRNFPPLTSRTASSFGPQRGLDSPFNPSLSDTTRERNSLRNLTLDQEKPVTPTSSRSLPSPRHPPHDSNLPTLPSIPRDDSQDPPLRPDADPLSVLAYAGRILGRENRPHRPPS
ncbi:hypothetical protein ABVK25_005005 [Lepraria finkii]|uniref:HMG box domain-containing protein n=1 Tax=Lepraria finkii TaxID=1340010 RepID=A0ABR4B9Z8_9LECA